MPEHGRFWYRAAAGLLTVAGLTVGVPVPAPAEFTAGPPIPQGGAVIRRTAHGIPHILAADHRGLGFGTGYAFAEDNACVMADTVLTVSAERSRWFGADSATVYGEDNLVSDLYHQQINQSGTIERLLGRPAPLGPSAEARDLVRGYAAGFNRYLADRGVANLPDPGCRGAAWVRPITELDLWRRVYQLTGLGGGEALQAAVVSAQPPGDGSGAGVDPAAGDRVRSSLRRLGELGSNAYALGRRATTAGTGMVLANPHFPWFGDRRFYQQHLTIPGVLNVSGAALYGLPVVNIGHTERMAWTHTVSTARTFTITRLTLTPGDPTGYVVDGHERRMTRRDVTTIVREPGGGLAPVTRTSYHTPDGPVVQIPGLLDWTTSTAYVLRDANAGNLRILDQWLAINRAQTVGQVRAALIHHQGAPWVNTLAADSTGTASYSDIQVVPHVTDELLARCAIDVDDDELIVLDGSRASCAWGTDPDAIEPGLLGPGRLPGLTRADFVANSNDSPWLTNPAAPLSGYPAVVGDVGTERSPRTRLGLDMITDGLDHGRGFSLEGLQATMFGNRNLTAELGRDSLVAMCRAHPTLTASDGRTVDVRAACRTLTAWNGRADTDSRGAFLWRRFFQRAQNRVDNLWLVPFDPAHPVDTPRAPDLGQPGARQALADTVQEFARTGLPVDVPLGSVQRHNSIPIHGCTNGEGCFNIARLNDRGGNTFPDIDFGTTFVMAVELSPSGPRSRTILTYGQTQLYSEKEWVKGRFTEAEIARDPDLTVHPLYRVAS
ncbi:MAG TPA: penicillin acylase family protein [Candidatus Limnocylindrales bacterium]